MKEIVTKEDVLQAINNPKMKIGLKQGFVIQIYKIPFLEKIKALITTKKLKTLFWKGMIVTLDGNKICRLGFGYDFNKDDAALGRYVNHLNETLNQELNAMEIRKKVLEALQDGFGDRFSFDIETSSGK